MRALGHFDGMDKLFCLEENGVTMKKLNIVLFFMFMFFGINSSYSSSNKSLLLHAIPTNKIWFASIAFSPDSDKVAFGGGSSDIYVLSVITGKLLKTLKGHKGWVGSVAFSKDGKKLASGGGNDKTVKIWDTKTWKMISTFKGHSDQIRSVSFSPNGNYVISSSKSNVGVYGRGKILIWDINNENLFLTVDGLKGIEYVSYSLDGKYFYANALHENSGLAIWDSSNGSAIPTKNISSSFNVSPSLKYAVSKKFRHALGLLNLKTGELVHKLNNASFYIDSTRFSSNGQRVLSIGSQGGLSTDVLKIWDVKTGKFLTTLNGYNGAHSIKVATYSNNEKYIATGDTDNTLRIWNAEPFSTIFNKKINSRFSKAKHENTIDGFRGFINMFNDKARVSNHLVMIDQARKSITSLTNKMKFEKALQQDVWDGYTKFIHENPKATETRKAIQRIYKIAEKENTIDVFKRFINEHPNSDDAVAARNKLLILLKQNGDINDYYKFLSMKDEVVYSIANDLVSKIYKQEVKKHNNIKSIKLFLNDFIGGLPKDVFDMAINDAVQIEFKNILDQHDKLVEEENGWIISKFSRPDHSKHVAKDSVEWQIRETIARTIFGEAIKSKGKFTAQTEKKDVKQNIIRLEDSIRKAWSKSRKAKYTRQLDNFIAEMYYNEFNNLFDFLVKYKTISDSPILKETQTTFDVLKDDKLQQFVSDIINKYHDSKKEMLLIKLLNDSERIKNNESARYYYITRYKKVQ